MIAAIISSVLGGLLATVVIEIFRRIANKEFSLKLALTTLSILSILVAASDFTPIRIAETIRVSLFPWTLPDNELWVREAWLAMDENRYKDAIVAAERVTNLFAGTARQDQEALYKEGGKAPPVKKVSPWAAVKIFENGVLNDVAASYWIIGRSQELLDQPSLAKKAYCECTQFPYARVLDPQWWPMRGWSPVGWFWSPELVCKNRVTETECQEVEMAKK